MFSEGFFYAIRGFLRGRRIMKQEKYLEEIQTNITWLEQTHLNAIFLVKTWMKHAEEKGDKESVKLYERILTSAVANYYSKKDEDWRHGRK